MVSLYKALEVLYRILLYGFLPYVMWLNYGLSLEQVLTILATVFVMDTFCEACGWVVYRSGEFHVIKGLFSAYMFTAVLVLTALLLNLDISFIYLPIIAVLGVVAFLFSSRNRIFNPFGFTAMTFLTLTVLLATLLTPAYAFLPFVFGILSFILIRRGFEEANIGFLYRIGMYIRLGLSLIITVFLAIIFFKEMFAYLLSHSMFIFKDCDLSVIPSIFLYNSLIASFEEFIGRGFIPFVSAGLCSYVFSSLHIPKLITIGFTELDTIMHAHGFSTFSTIYTLLCSITWICLGTMLFVETWRKSGLLGSILVHAIVNTVIFMIALGMTHIVMILTIVLMIMHYIWGRKTGFQT